MPMRLDANQVGDIVEVDRLGRRFHALIAGNASGGLSIQPLDGRINYVSPACRGPRMNDSVPIHDRRNASTQHTTGV
jgi:hypothetical protein